MQLAEEHGITSIAFPNISTGVYGYPKEKAAHIAIQTVQEIVPFCKIVKEVYFVCFDNENFEIYKRALGDVK
jgi:O-acetyl-ADP-ribose deacetylase (regulator of RNase III)